MQSFISFCLCVWKKQAFWMYPPTKPWVKATNWPSCPVISCLRTLASVFRFFTTRKWDKMDSCYVQNTTVNFETKFMISFQLLWEANEDYSTPQNKIKKCRLFYLREESSITLLLFKIIWLKNFSFNTKVIMK